MNFSYGGGVHPDVVELLEDVAVAVPASAQRACAEVTIAVSHWGDGDAEGPVVAIPLATASTRTRWQLHQRPPDCIALLDVADALVLPNASSGVPVVGIGLPRPAGPVTSSIGLDIADAPLAVRKELAKTANEKGNAQAPISVVSGFGGRCLARMTLAAHRGQAIIGLTGPVGPPDPFFGAVLSTDGPLEALEATELLANTPALRIAIANAAHRRLARLPGPEIVAGRLLEAIALATERHAVGPRRPTIGAQNSLGARLG